MKLMWNLSIKDWFVFWLILELKANPVPYTVYTLSESPQEKRNQNILNNCILKLSGEQPSGKEFHKNTDYWTKNRKKYYKRYILFQFFWIWEIPKNIKISSWVIE